MSLQKIIITLLVFLAALCLWPGTANGNSNQFYIGVSFNLSTGGQPDLSSMQPWIKARINESTPNSVNRFRANEMHHAYAGAALLGLGYLTKVRTLKVAGGLLIVDDAIQHLLRVNSPVHMLNDELYRHGWYRSLLDIGSSIAGQDQ